MPIQFDPNVFKAFEQFAANSSAGTRAQVSELYLSPFQSVSTVKASSRFDFCGNIGRGSDSQKANNQVRDLFRGTIAAMFGGEHNIPDSVKAEMKLGDYGKGKPLTARRIAAVINAAKAAVTPENGWGTVSGPMAGLVVRHALKGTGLENVQNPAAELSRRQEAIGRAEISTHIASFMKSEACVKDAPGQYNFDSLNTAFDGDLTRGGITIKLPGVKRFPRDPAKARDEFVKFITGNKKAKFATATDEVKKKTFMLMSLSYQGAMGCLMGMTGVALDAHGKNAMISGGTMRPEDRECSVAFSRTKTGDIVVKSNIVFHSPILHLTDGDGVLKDLNGDDESYLKQSMTLTLTDGEMTRLANTDWHQYDADAFKAVDDEADDYLVKRGDLLPKDLRFQGEFNSRIEVHANELYDDSFQPLNGDEW